MCTFLSTLPKKSKSTGANKTKNLVLSLRVCPDTPEKTAWYQLRILNFASKTDRDGPFIQRYIHQVWKKNEKGFNVIDSEVVCPVTKWMAWDEDRYSCPICRYANQQWHALEQSGYKDKDAREKNNKFQRKFQAIVPVYVVSDPNYEGNNGKFKVIIFSDKDEYTEFYKKLEKQLMKGNCFNGVNASDLCLHIGTSEKIVNEGLPNQYIYKRKVIDKIAFSKPYDLPKITKEAIDATFPFDDTYYVASTKAEIEDFYNKYIKVAGPVLMDDDSEEELKVYDKPTSAPVAQTVKAESMQNVAVKSEVPSTVDLTDVGLDDPVETALNSVPTKTDSAQATSVADIDAESLLAGIEDYK